MKKQREKNPEEGLTRLGEYDSLDSSQPLQYFALYCGALEWASRLSKDKIFAFMFKLMQLAMMNSNVVVLSSDVRARVRAEMDISDVTYIALMKRLRSAGLIVGMMRPDPKTSEPVVSKTEFMLNPSFVWKGQPEYRANAILRFTNLLQDEKKRGGE